MLARLWSALGMCAGSLFICTPEAMAASCEVNPQGVSFGNYDPLNIIPHDGVGNIHIRCDLLTGFTVSLGSGIGTVSDRQMIGGAPHLRYNLYKGPARLVVWGDSGASSVSAIGSNVNMPVYGRIPPRQNVPANAYVDVVVVTITY